MKRIPSGPPSIPGGRTFVLGLAGGIGQARSGRRGLATTSAGAQTLRSAYFVCRSSWLRYPRGAPRNSVYRVEMEGFRWLLWMGRRRSSV